MFVWPATAAPGNEFGTGTWFNWVKTYSALAGCLGFIAVRYVRWTDRDGTVRHLYEKKWAPCFPPLILAFNIGVAIYQFRRPRKNKLNSLTDELYRDIPAHARIIEENR